MTKDWRYRVGLWVNECFLAESRNRFWI